MALGATVARWSGRRCRTLRRREGGYYLGRDLRGIDKVCVVQSRGVGNGFPHDRPRPIVSLRSIKRGALLWWWWRQRRFPQRRTRNSVGSYRPRGRHRGGIVVWGGPWKCHDGTSGGMALTVSLAFPEQTRGQDRTRTRNHRFVEGYRGWWNLARAVQCVL